MNFYLVEYLTMLYTLSLVSPVLLPRYPSSCYDVVLVTAIYSVPCKCLCFQWYHRKCVYVSLNSQISRGDLRSFRSLYVSPNWGKSLSTTVHIFLLLISLLGHLLTYRVKGNLHICPSEQQQRFIWEKKNWGPFYLAAPVENLLKDALIIFVYSSNFSLVFIYFPCNVLFLNLPTFPI